MTSVIYHNIFYEEESIIFGSCSGVPNQTLNLSLIFSHLGFHPDRVFLRRVDTFPPILYPHTDINWNKNIHNFFLKAQLLLEDFYGKCELG